MSDRIAAARRQLLQSGAGNASAGHLAMAYLSLVSETFMLHVPYRGTGPQLTDLLAHRGRRGGAHAGHGGAPERRRGHGRGRARQDQARLTPA